jgi:hypothetical protein
MVLVEIRMALLCPKEFRQRAPALLVRSNLFLQGLQREKSSFLAFFHSAGYLRKSRRFTGTLLGH